MGRFDSPVILSTRVEAALEDSAGQESSLNRVRGLARFEHGFDLVH
jgi:hypothetical protein